MLLSVTTATASSVEGAGLEAAKAVDGSLGTRWSSQFSDPQWLYPSEDRKLMGCYEVPLVERLFYGVLAREGLRASEALSLTWEDVDLENGMLHLDENKTDDARSWVLDTGVAEALRRWKRNFARSTLANARVFLRPEGGDLDRFALAERLRQHLKAAGVARAQLFEESETRMPLRAHDLRGTFVTVSMALGKTEAWVTDRTGHRSSQMIYESTNGRSEATLRPTWGRWRPSTRQSQSWPTQARPSPERARYASPLVPTDSSVVGQITVPLSHRVSPSSTFCGPRQT